MKWTFSRITAQNVEIFYLMLVMRVDSAASQPCNRAHSAHSDVVQLKVYRQRFPSRSSGMIITQLS